MGIDRKDVIMGKGETYDNSIMKCGGRREEKCSCLSVDCVKDRKKDQRGTVVEKHLSEIADKRGKGKKILINKNRGGADQSKKGNWGCGHKEQHHVMKDTLTTSRPKSE